MLMGHHESTHHLIRTEPSCKNQQTPLQPDNPTRNPRKQPKTTAQYLKGQAKTTKRPHPDLQPMTVTD